LEGFGGAGRGEEGHFKFLNQPKSYPNGSKAPSCYTKGLPFIVVFYHSQNQIQKAKGSKFKFEKHGQSSRFFAVGGTGFKQLGSCQDRQESD
jgi:hypothetical protein